MLLRLLLLFRLLLRLLLLFWWPGPLSPHSGSLQSPRRLHGEAGEDIPHQRGEVLVVRELLLARTWLLFLQRQQGTLLRPSRQDKRVEGTPT
jgi:hypothetical protein